MVNTYGRHVTHVDGEMFNGTEWNKLIDYAIYATKVLADVAVAGWGSNESGRMIFVSGEGKWYYWNGSSLTGFPSVGGSGAPNDATYVTISNNPDLVSETLHKDIIGVNLHICKVHATTHNNGGTDEINVAGLNGVLADYQNAGFIKDKTIDATGIGNGKLLGYNSGTNHIEYYTAAGGGDMTKAVYDTVPAGGDGIVDNADNAHTVDSLHAAAFALVTHKDTHKTGGGANAFLVTDLIDGISRMNILKSGAVIGTRRGIDLIAGTGITLTMTDVPGTAATEKVTVQIDASVAAEHHDILSTTHSDTTVATEVDGSILQYVTDKWVQKKSKRGTATVANNGTIAHGLGLNPSTVFLTANAVQPYALAYEKDATNITVHHNAAGTLTVSYWAIE